MNSDSVPSGSLSPTLIVMVPPGTCGDGMKTARAAKASTSCTSDARGLRIGRGAGVVSGLSRVNHRRRLNAMATRSDRAPCRGAARVRVLIATRKGLWTLAGDATRRTWKLVGAGVPRPRRAPRDASIRATARRCSPRRAPGISGRRSSARSTAGARGRKRARRRPSPRTAGAWSTTRSGSRRGTRRSRASGTRARRRRACSARRTAASRGKASAGSTSTRPQGVVRRRPGRHARRRRSCTRSSSTRATPRTCTSACRAAACSSRTTRVRDWHPLNEGVRADFFPDPYPVFGQDPHCVRMAERQSRPPVPAEPLRHLPARPPGARAGSASATTCRSRWATSASRSSCTRTTRTRRGSFPWTAPTCGRARRPAASPAAYRTRDGGKTWKRQSDRLPKTQAWWTVKRQAMTADASRPAGVYFGTTSGEVWGTRDEGRTWWRLAEHLPEIYASSTA